MLIAYARGLFMCCAVVLAAVTGAQAQRSALRSAALTGGDSVRHAAYETGTVDQRHLRFSFKFVGSTLDQRVTVQGRVLTLPMATDIVLQMQRGTGWRTVARARLSKQHSFTLRWHPPPTQVLRVEFRVVALHRSHELTHSYPLVDELPRPPVQCAAPAAPGYLPPGDGWITGGLYTSGGGPPPGIPSDCSATAYAVTATNTSGAVIATENVPGRHSYTLVVPAGTYTLRSGICQGTAQVTAGKQTKADTGCPGFP